MDAHSAGKGVERLAGERETYCDMRSMWRRECGSAGIGAIFERRRFVDEVQCALRQCWFVMRGGLACGQKSWRSVDWDADGRGGATPGQDWDGVTTFDTK